MADEDLGTARGRVEIDASTLTHLSAGFTRLGAVMLGFGGAMLAGFGYAVNAAAEFERQLSRFQAVTGATDAQMEVLKQQLLDLGNTSVYSADQIAEAAIALGKAGLTTEQVMGGATEAVIALAAAAEGMTLDQAAEIAANAMKTFNLETTDLMHVVDQLAGAANKSTLEVQDLAVSMRYVGPVAATMGVSVDELSTALAILGDRGIKGSTAGTSLRGILLSLTPTSKEAEKAMRELGLITADGSNQFFDAAGNMKSLAEVSQILGDATRHLSEEQKAETFNTIFQRRAMASALILAEQGTKGFKDYADAINQTSAADVAAKKLDNLSGDMQKLQNHFKSFVIEAGGPFQETGREFIQTLDNLLTKFQELSPEQQKFILQVLLYGGIILTALGTLSLFLGSLIRIGQAVSGVATGMKALGAAMNLGGILSSIGSAFSSLGATLLANPVFLVIAAIVLLIGLLVLLYFKWEPFREWVDDTWEDFQRGLDVVREWGNTAGEKIDFVEEKIQELWARFQDGLTTLQNWKDNVINFFSTLGDTIGQWGENVAGWLSTAWNAVTTFISEIPAKISGFLSAAWDTVTAFFSDLPYKIGYALGFLLGTLVNWAISAQQWGLETGGNIIEALISFFTSLPVSFDEFSLNHELLSSFS